MEFEAVHHGSLQTKTVKLTVSDTNLVVEKHKYDLNDVVGAKIVTSPIVSVCVCPKPGKKRDVEILKYEFGDEKKAQGFCDSLNEKVQAHDPSTQTRRIVVIINPFSGKGKAVEMWEKQLTQIIHHIPHCKVEVNQTKAPGHAAEISKGIELPSENDLLDIAICGGDGLLNEAINGFFSGSETKKLDQITFTHIGCGTSNGMAHSCDMESAITGALALSKRKTKPWDLTAVRLKEYPKSLKKACLPEEHLDEIPPLYMLGVFSWAVVADLDIGTEDLRWMGDFRMTVGAIKRIILGKTFKAKLAFTTLPSEGKESLSSSSSSTNNNRLGETVLNSLPKTVAECEGKEGWQVKDSEFLVLSASKLKVVDPTFPITPNAEGSGGFLDLLWSEQRDFPGLFDKIGMMDDVEKAIHVKDKRWGQEKVSAFILEPSPETKFMTVDGEKVKNDIVSVAIVPGVSINMVHHM
eukprot:Lithocolla_globosa_v1_NODE_3979_length_1538_cov_8.758597.p1 type:complete len:465 gc:universal NODE_3979_length_1538_cov_8.758597:134-1528(+)